MNKVYPDAQTAIADLIKDHQTLAVGGFGLCGIPEALIAAVHKSGAVQLTCISNNAGIDNYGLGLLLQTKQIKRMIASYVGENKEFERQFLNGELEVELNPQGTLAERLRAGGAGIPAFFTQTGVGTQIANGKESREFEGKEYIMELALKADIGLIKAQKADKAGNLIFNRTAQNFNPVCAKASAIAIAEVEEIVEIGELDPDEIQLPGIYIDRIILNQSPEKKIERLTLKGGV